MKYKPKDSQVRVRKYPKGNWEDFRRPFPGAIAPRHFRYAMMRGTRWQNFSRLIWRMNGPPNISFWWHKKLDKKGFLGLVRYGACPNIGSYYLTIAYLTITVITGHDSRK